MAYASNVVTVVGVSMLLNGAIAYYWRFNFITGAIYGRSLIPVYIIFAAVLVCILGLALRVKRR